MNSKKLFQKVKLKNRHMSAIAPVVYHRLEMLGQVIPITNRSIILIFLV